MQMTNLVMLRLNIDDHTNVITSASNPAQRDLTAGDLATNYVTWPNFSLVTLDLISIEKR